MEWCAKVGLNTEILDIDLGVCNKLPDFISNRKALIKNIVGKKVTTSTGHALKFIGTTMENVPDLPDATQVQFDEEAK